MPLPSAPAGARACQRYLWSAVALALATMSAWGCDDRPQVVPVTGTVLYQGKPIAEAAVMFYPENHRPASATTDANGRFELMTTSPDDGAIVGAHRVTVVKNVERMPPTEENPYPTFRNALPARYQIPDTSGLTATVTADGENDFVFELKD